jgi:hypothetical protein
MQNAAAPAGSAAAGEASKPVAVIAAATRQTILFMISPLFSWPGGK